MAAKATLGAYFTPRLAYKRRWLLCRLHLGLAALKCYTLTLRYYLTLLLSQDTDA